MGNNQGKPVVFTDGVNLNHFRLLRVVGKGAFGKVRIVERKDTGLTFALKYIRKDEGGGSVRERTEYSARTADAGTIEPSIHLQSANVASDFTPGKLLTSKSGTLAYLAPEVYKGNGYSCGADWWSLGRPFEGSTQTVLAGQISKASPAFPITSPPVSMPCLHAISSALEEDPNKRMGSASFISFTDNPFFRPLDFEALERKEIEPVFVPSADKTNFDATYDLEELLLEEAPLEARARRQKPREALKEDATDKEIREDELYKMIELQFTTFDYTKAALARYAGIDMDGQPQPADWPVPPSGVPPPLPDSSTPKPISPRSPSVGRRRSSTRSQPNSPDGSPPVPVPPLPNNIQNGTATSPQRLVPNFSTPNSGPSGYHQSYSGPRNPRGQGGGFRKESQGGGMQVVLGETGSWSDLAKQDATLPADAKLVEAAAKPTGMMSFLSRKKGRGHSPKPQERGILGKEGARVIISSDGRAGGMNGKGGKAESGRSAGSRAARSRR
ncbi:hypothetical protein B7463_g1191, partial [Scytalidium lignicola]